jgi:hypothetical protein
MLSIPLSPALATLTGPYHAPKALITKEAQEVLEYVKKHKGDLLKKSKAKGIDFYATPGFTGLARALLFTQNKVLLLFNRKKAKGDLALSETPHKTVTLAMDLESGNLYTSSSMEMDELLRERKGAYLLKGIPGFAGYSLSIDYLSKNQRRKTRAFRPLAVRGDLAKASSSLTTEEKNIVCQKLIKSICSMHKRGLIHRDIKPKNILIYGKGKSIRPEIIDLSSVVHVNDTKEKSVGVWTEGFAAPEYLNALREGTPIALVTTSACDIWAIGKVLSQLFETQEEANKPPLKILERMLQVDPKNRMTSEELSSFNVEEA